MRRLRTTRLPALLLAAALLAGCGEASPSNETATEPSPVDPSMSVGDPVQEPTVVDVVTGFDAGGRVSAEPVPVGTPEEMADFADQLEDARMVRQLRAAAKSAVVPDGQSLLAAVVAIGCVPPSIADIEVDVRGGAPTVTAAAQKSDQECFAAMISVALVTAVV